MGTEEETGSEEQDAARRAWGEPAALRTPLTAGKETGPQPYVWPRGLNSAYTGTSEETFPTFPIPHPRPQPCWPPDHGPGRPLWPPNLHNCRIIMCCFKHLWLWAFVMVAIKQLIHQIGTRQ